jgi:branched-chain amino acid transport system permease protein
VSTAFYIQLVVSGIAIGSVYGLVALGFVTIYRTSGVVNFTQGDFVMLGAMLSYFLWKSWGLAYPLACGLTVLAVALLSLAIYHLVIAPLRRSDPIMIIMATLGVSIVIEMVAQLLWTSYPIYGPAFSGTHPATLFGVSIEWQQLWVVGLGALVLVGLFYLNNRTRLGKSMTATATDRLGANLVGVRTGSMIRWAFIISAAIGAAAGIFISPLLPMAFNIGIMLSLKGFVAAVVGGWGKPSGAFVGGLVIGVLETIAGGVFQAGYRDAVAFGILLIVLYFRPQGLLGSSLVEADA